MSSSLSKILETGINVFKSNSQIMKNTKYTNLEFLTPISLQPESKTKECANFIFEVKSSVK